jgi:hypothetical protein
MKKYILISLLLLSVISCTKTIDFDDEDLANQLVLNSIIYSDQGIRANLTFSTSILTRPTLAGGGLIAEGTIEIYENGKLLNEQYSPTGVFEFPDIRPKPGATYKVVGKSHDKQLEAETTVPEKVEVISIDTMIVNNYFINKRLQVNVKIKDVAGDNFYRITVSRETLVLNMNVDGKGTKKYYQYTGEDWISSDNPVFNSLYNNFGGEEFDIGPANDYKIFPDDYFKGKEYSIRFFINNYDFGNPSSPGSYGGGTIKPIYSRRVVHIQHLSKDLFTYLKYLKLYDFYHDNPFAEPVPVYSNVKNGVGIFAGFNDDAKFTYEKVYIPYSMDTITIDKYPYSGY